MKKVSKITMLFVIAMAMMMAACESPSKGNSNDKSNSKEPKVTSFKYPTITEKGVTPFLLNESFLNVPPQGDYYDNIKLNRFYSVIMGDYVIDIADEKLNDYYDDFGSDAEVLGFYGTGVVIQGNDTLLIATYDENGIITEIEVFSEKIHFENGIHVGLSSETMASKYDASFLTTSYFPGQEVWMCYYVKGLPKNITLWATNVYDIFDVDDGYGVPIPSRGKGTRNGCFFQYIIPMDKVKDSHLASIRILSKDYESFNP